MQLLVKVILTLWVSWARGQEIACDPPRIANSHYLPKRTNYGLEQEITYYCTSGFLPSSRGNTAKCTDKGWDPPPRCSLNPCEFPEIKHGLLYKEDKYKSYFPAPIKQWFYYSCDENYVTPPEDFWHYITCTQDGWTPEVPCRRKCVFDDLKHVRSPSKEQRLLQGESLKIDCDPGYSLSDPQSTVTCTENGWSSPPSCIKSSDKCGPPPGISNGDITSVTLKMYHPWSTVKYQCQAYYELQGPKYVTCSYGKWSKPPRCIDPCVLSEKIMKEKNIQLNGKYDKTYFIKSGNSIDFKCKSGLKAVTSVESFQALCLEGKMEYPTCK
ncbi:complement factor H-related protein 2-like isoform X4 [Myotis lucifugus]|uniref:complement factor H-related protein 2-like isoform X4 n=1 Tax=Myotis lucifugus TaxID=59463 RepID=UPI000CCC52B5|nr:complement factor H-related protein 2-like isoform X4 [Myotis lucifugus]